MTHPRKPLRAVAAWAATAAILMLAGCGGGGGGDGGPTNIGGNGTGGGTSGGALPASALQSSDGFVAYLKQVVANRFDTSEPIDLGNAVAAPTSNTTEAVGL
ncbi:MAG: hypothetical protein EOP13_00765 [Pseudomonas sp.]|uniref:hypothetical protein n=1 Tax=Pseudomonas sp. TaxID=306 RepID=UPI00120094AA|nr:hypothetical protein [Pseudomonas sp.]RZI76851.1 MAG: hypothetical protein EOP13_00765 [Pseudomonas sp.]